MRLKLRLLNGDLAERVAVSPTLCSHIFTTWFKLLSRVLGKALDALPLKESVGENLPKIFLKSSYGKCHVIVDFAQMFIKRPKSLSAQTATLSDYKHHNTFKCLVGITPTGLITRDNGFYYLLERDNEVNGRQGFVSSRRFASSIFQIGCFTWCTTEKPKV